MNKDTIKLYNIWLKIAMKDLDRANAAYVRKDTEFVFFHSQQAL
jgi:HEPN domain-containing protein